MNLRQIAKNDLALVLDDEAEYFGKQIPVIFAEAETDMGIIPYLICNEEDVQGLCDGQDIKVDDCNYRVVNFLSRVDGSIHIDIKRVEDD